MFIIGVLHIFLERIPIIFTYHILEFFHSLFHRNLITILIIGRCCQQINQSTSFLLACFILIRFICLCCQHQQTTEHIISLWFFVILLTLWFFLWFIIILLSLLSFWFFLWFFIVFLALLALWFFLFIILFGNSTTKPTKD